MRSVLLHGHIFKNAGTTLDWSLERNFGGGFVDHRRDDVMRSQGGKHIASLLLEDPSIMAISSHHMPGNVPEIKGVRIQRIYLLRHPIRRIRSVYDFERKQKAQTPGAVAAKKMDFQQYVEWRMQGNVAPTIRNFQSRYLAGVVLPLSEKTSELAYFELAFQALENIPSIGIVEHYDESMVMLEVMLQPFFPDLDLSHVPQNVGRKGLGLGRASRNVSGILNDLGDLQERVIQFNSFDLALYEAAKERFKARTESIGGFPDRLKEFRERCRLVSGRK